MRANKQKLLASDNQKEKKDIFESVYTDILTKVNNNLGISMPEKPKQVEKQSESIKLVSTPSNELEIPIVNEIIPDKSKEETKPLDPKQEEKVKEMQRKLTEYNKKLINEFLSIPLAEEREKSLLREKEYQSTKDPVEKKNLEKLMALERAQSSDHINKIKNEIDAKVKLYETQLNNKI
jgi:hypothetical protein